MNSGNDSSLGGPCHALINSANRCNSSAFSLSYSYTRTNLHSHLINCMRQTVKTYLEREHSILPSVTHTLYVYQVCHGVGRCVTVKDGSCSSSSLEWKLMHCINGISYYLDKCQTLSNTSQMTIFFFQEDSSQVHCVCNTIQLSEICDFRVSAFCHVVQKHKLLEVA